MLYLHCTRIYYGYVHLHTMMSLISMFQYFSSWIPWFGPFFVQTFSLFHISRGALSSGNGNTGQRVFFKSDFLKKRWEFWSFERHWSFYLSTSELHGKHCEIGGLSGPIRQWATASVIGGPHHKQHLVWAPFGSIIHVSRHMSTIAMIVNIVHVPTAFWKILFRTSCRFGPTPIGYQGGTVSQGSLGSGAVWQQENLDF